MLVRYRKLILWIAAAVIVVLVWNWPSKADRLGRWAKEKDAVFQHRNHLREAILQTRKDSDITSKELEVSELNPSGTLQPKEEEVVEKAFPLPEVPTWIIELVKEQEATKKK